MIGMAARIDSNDDRSRPRITRGVCHALVAVTVVQMAAALWMCPPIRQDPGYHRMADERTVLGIPNALNVLSNLPFAAVGGFGLWVTLRRRSRMSRFTDAWLRWPYAAFFTGTLLTAFGSSYYHLAPDNWRLVWDRLPMTLAFMGLLAALLGERVSAFAGRLLLGPLLFLGTASVAYWYWTEQHGTGDLRPYVLVQFGSLLVIALLLFLYPSPTRDAHYFVAGLIAYGAAKAFELCDEPLLRLTHVVSGHSLKHLMAAAAVGWLAMRVHRAGRGTMAVPGAEIR